MDVGEPNRERERVKKSKLYMSIMELNLSLFFGLMMDGENL